MKAEYIEREAVIDTIYAAFKKYWAIPCSSVDLAVQRDVVHTKNKIYDIPAADVVPVVRCKDCIKHIYEDDVDYICGRTGTYTRFDDFCSYGERKDGAS